ncbi:MULTISPECIES: extracellular solute-binding protein [Arthrobacter]|uniref:Extracellular solute-binding protein n=1 Tax=Arthrobacter terricola TaxID=2547396 RepID=A0A4R5K8Q6_9MICC|nr:MULTISPECIES: extracellular solute-binding protein [Arthrobacter]MBT8163278.1 extracellular solute-binding protein [Arthrobacter sp. GN70]TDF91192.1 extracellular solute-binding protein [Arthrobacter terricola]
MNRKRSLARTGTAILAAGLAAGALSACSQNSSAGSSQTGDGTGTINVWAHQGQDSEIAVMQAAVSSFNSSQSKIKVNLRLISSDTYTSTITNTPKDKLPDVMEMDGPTLASYVYNQKLSPLKQYVSASTVSNATDGSTAEGTYNGDLYGLAMYDSGLGLYGNKKLLDAAGVAYPKSAADAWTADQFTTAVKALASKSPAGKSLDVNESSLGNEWATYAFSPLVESAGGGLIKDNKADGTLNSSASVKALTTVQGWKPYVDSNADGNAFPNGRVALAWGGHWNYPTYSKALGSDLVALPLPNFGGGTKTDAGSWTFGISSGTKNGKAAGAFLDALLSDRNVKAMTDANGAPPATKSALAADKLYQPGGALALWGDQLNHACPATAVTPSCIAVYRPVTPGYPTITAKFAGALSAIWGGSDAKTQLDNAAKAIDQAYTDNSNYQ